MSENEKQDKPKIIVDSDWKEQAKKEKEELARKAEQESQQSPRGGQGQAPPKPDFITHCASLATQAMISMGAIAHPLTGQAQVDHAQARYVIDTLEMLKEKTQGNLDDEEARTLDSLVSELKLVWVQVTQSSGQSSAEDPGEESND